MSRLIAGFYSARLYKTLRGAQWKQSALMVSGASLSCPLAVLDPRVGHTVDVLSPFISVLCHSDWLFHGKSCPRLDCCPSRLCVVFLACVHLALFLALSVSPGNFLVSSWCEHSMLASLLWRCLTVPSVLRFVKSPFICFFAVHEPCRNLQNLESFHCKGVQTCK